MISNHQLGGLAVTQIPAPAPSPARLLLHQNADDRPFALISGHGDPALSRFSYAALQPYTGALTLKEATEEASRLLSHRALPKFCSGAVGYLSYDLGFSYQLKPRPPRPDPLDFSAQRFHVYDTVYARDERSLKGYLIAQPTREAMLRAQRLERALFEPAIVPQGGSSALSPAVSQAKHQARIREALQLIREGEIYQVNLTYPLEGTFSGAPQAAYLRLLSAAPPFSAFLGLGDQQALISASPECFFDFDAKTRLLASYPIKGTRAAAQDPARDRALKSALLQDAKERAEHLMIVDLLRNDIGKLCELGSVAVDGLCYLESFPTVHHLTSRVLGKVQTSRSLPEIVEALFPGGSITGCPKLRAMEVIDRLEDAPRGVYTGAIGYITPEGSMRTNIAIRTAQISRGEVRFGVGGGIVADSKPDLEWEETLVKAKALSAALVGG